MLTINERHQIILRLSMIQHNSVWGLAIQRFNARGNANTDAEILEIIQGIQSQIDDNPASMHQILGDHFTYFDTFHRNIELNIDHHIKRLLQRAVIRFNTRTEQAKALGISDPTLRNYLINYNIITPQP